MPRYEWYQLRKTTSTNHSLSNWHNLWYPETIIFAVQHHTPSLLSNALAVECLSTTSDCVPPTLNIVVCLRSTTSEYCCLPAFHHFWILLSGGGRTQADNNIQKWWNAGRQQYSPAFHHLSPCISYLFFIFTTSNSTLQLLHSIETTDELTIFLSKQWISLMSEPEQLNSFVDVEKCEYIIAVQYG